jgi:hypothetical protein
MAEEQQYDTPREYTLTKISNGWLASLTYSNGELEAICFEGKEAEALARAISTLFPSEEKAPAPPKEKISVRFVKPVKEFEEERL